MDEVSLDPVKAATAQIVTDIVHAEMEIGVAVGALSVALRVLLAEQPSDHRARPVALAAEMIGLPFEAGAPSDLANMCAVGRA